MGPRFSSKSSKGRFFFIFLIIMLILCVFYLYLLYTMENFKNAKSAERRCLSEMSSVKYQLNVVMERKSTVEKMLSESQNAHNKDREKYTDVAESCITMKQQSLLCQSQFDDLQSECKKVKEAFNKIKLDAEQLQKRFDEQGKEKKLLRQKTEEQLAEIENLHKIAMNSLYKTELESRPYDEGTLSRKTNINFTQQVEISTGVYVIGQSTEAASETKEFRKAEPKPSQSNKYSELVPPGFAPVLDVIENGDSINIAKSSFVRTMVGDTETNKLVAVGQKISKKSDERDLEVVGAIPESKDVIAEDNKGLNARLERGDERPMGRGEEAEVVAEAEVPLNEQENRPPQEDDDEGEEYGT